MSTFLSDLRHAARLLARNPGTSSLAVFTLALAIGATTAIFSVVYGVMLRPLPYPGADRLAAIFEMNRGRTTRLADPNFADFRDRSHAFDVMAKYFSTTTSVAGAGEPTRSTVAVVSKDFFTVMGVQPAVGRGFGSDETRLGGSPVAIVSHKYWTGALQSTRALTDVHLRIEGSVYTVVGVMPAGFAFPAKADLWLSAELQPENTSRTSHNFSAVGRLRAGVSAAQASSDLNAIAQDIERNSDEQGPYLLTGATAVPLQASLTGQVGSTLYVLLGAVFFLLLVASANVTNLLLAQAAARQRELAIRHALGAGRGRLVRQFVAESLLLVAASGGAGLLVAAFGLRALLAMAPDTLPRLEDVSMNGVVLAFAVGLAAAVALTIGLLTAIRATGSRPQQALAGGSRGQAGASSQRAGRVIVASQVAITMVLLVGAALLGRSLLMVLSVDPGFRTDQLVAMDLSMPYSSDPAVKARLVPFYRDVFERLRAIPGVKDVAATSGVPMDGGHPDGMFAVLDSASVVPKKWDDVRSLFEQKDRTGTADFVSASPSYFHALGIPLVRGRLFDDRDRGDGPHVAVITESLARTRWPNENPIGRVIEFGNMDGDFTPIIIVGIVGDTHEYGPEQAPRPTLYVDMMQRPRFAATVVIQSAADPGATTAAARRILRDVAPDVPPRFRTFDQIYNATLGPRRFDLTLVAVFAATALVLAVAGIYGVMAYSVTRRRREIGVRMALGATPGRVVRGVLGQGMATTAVGLVVGVAGAFGLTRLMESMLFGVTPTDPGAFAMVVALLAAVAFLACYVPARRATEVSPLEALRES